jgi:hypothetical protein
VAAAKPDAKSCGQLLEAAGLKNWQIGHSKVFLRYYHVEQLNVALTTFTRHVAICQKHLRAFVARRHYEQLKQAAQQYAEQLKQLRKVMDEINVTSVKKQKELHNEDIKNHKMKLEAETKAKLEAEQKKKDADDKEKRAALKRSKNPSTGTIVPGKPFDRPNLNVMLPTIHDGEELLCVSECNCTWKDFKATLESGSLSRRNVDPANTSQSLLADTLPKVSAIPPGLWAKVYLMEKNAIVGKFYLKDADMEINDSSSTYSGAVCGLNNDSFRHLLEDPQVTATLREIGRGARISRDGEGNVFVTRLTPCAVTVRLGHSTAESCLAKEIVSTKGVLGHNKTKVFDMSLYQRHIANALRSTQSTDPHIFNRLSTFSFSFGLNREIDIECPLWLFVVHFGALDLLGKANVLSAMIDQLSLSSADSLVLKKNWQHLDYMRPSVH